MKPAGPKKFIDGQNVRRPLFRRYGLWVGLALVSVIGIILIIVVRHQYFESLKPLSSSNSVVTVDIEVNSSTKEIADLLKEKGLIRASWAFQWYVNNGEVRNMLQAGTYELRPSQSVEEIVAQLTHGRVATKLVKLIPGTRLSQVKQAFIDSGFQPDEVDAAFNPELYKDNPVLADMPAGIDSLEGLLYPDFYQRDNNTKPEQIVQEALSEMQKYLTPDIRAAFAKHNLTVYQGITLASIVESEEPIASERPTVAQVFLKRLKEGVALGSDPTSLYGALKDGLELPSDPSEAANEAILHDSPYNTRMHSGLPPTPISTVEISALKAVANPAKTDYLYFIAGKDCNTHFAKTLAEHNENIEKYGLSTQNPACHN